MKFKQTKIFASDLNTLKECWKEHDRLMAEARKLSDYELARKFEVTPQHINKLRITHHGRNR